MRLEAGKTTIPARYGVWCRVLRIRLSQPPAGDWLAGAWAELGNYHDDCILSFPPCNKTYTLASWTFSKLLTSRSLALKHILHTLMFLSFCIKRGKFQCSMSSLLEKEDILQHNLRTEFSSYPNKVFDMYYRVIQLNWNKFLPYYSGHEAPYELR